MNGLPEFPPLELVRTIAAARLVMPTSVVRLSAGRASMSEELHALCLHAGASSIFLGERLLTADNAGEDADQAILEQLDTALKV
jgi:biotin synthase